MYFRVIMRLLILAALLVFCVTFCAQCDQHGQPGYITQATKQTDSRGTITQVWYVPKTAVVAATVLLSAALGWGCIHDLSKGGKK